MSRTYRNWLLALPGILAKHDPKNVESIMVNSCVDGVVFRVM